MNNIKYCFESLETMPLVAKYSTTDTRKKD